MENNINDVVTKMSKFSMIMGIVGTVVLGAVPAFGMMAIAVPIVFKSKKINMTVQQTKWCKIGLGLGIFSLVLFVIDFIIAIMFV